MVCLPRNLAHNTSLVYVIVLKWIESKTIVICSKLRAKLRLWGFLRVLGTFSHKMAQNWFVCYETRHTTLFGICYWVEMVRIENNSHMLEITWIVAIVMLFKRFWHFRASSSLNLVCFAWSSGHKNISYILLFSNC